MCVFIYFPNQHNVTLSFRVEPTCQAGEVAVHVVAVVVLDAPLSVIAQGNRGCVQTGHVMQQSLGGVASHRAKLYGHIKHLCCDYGSWDAAKIGQLLHHLSLQKYIFYEGRDKKKREKEYDKKCEVIRRTEKHLSAQNISYVIFM